MSWQGTDVIAVGKYDRPYLQEDMSEIKYIDM
jgi:hypothetical protein